MTRTEDLEALLAEQVAYYRARAPEYLSTTLADVFDSEVSQAVHQVAAELDALAPLGNVLELACGPGTFTPDLLARATTLTGVDASPEMIEIGTERVGHDPRAMFQRANLFEWRPERRYDFIFFGFWLSHVPLERFDGFWGTVADALAPGGTVYFVDDAYRTDDELIEGPESSTIERRLENGSAFRAVKVPHDPASLQARLDRLGWRIEVGMLAVPFFRGSGTRA